MRTSTLQFNQPDDVEEVSRADLYGLLSRLWLAAPDEALLAKMRPGTSGAGDAEGQLAAPWRTLIAALRATDANAASVEYDALFQGVGKPEVMLYGSYYVTGFLNEGPLVLLRSELRDLGLARDETRAETEDHIAFLFEVMRYLVAGDDAAVCNLERQRRFFRAHLQPWVERLCDAVEAHPGARLWRAIAGLTRAFMQVEAQGFDMLEA